MDFALIGAAGYVAPRHLQAIFETKNNLVAAVDPHDSVGILDKHFQDAHFFTEFERFDRHAEKLKRKGEGIDYVSICTPNYLHDAHIRFALRIGADAICEKPLVINPWNLDALAEMEREFGKKVWCIMQLRLHPDIIALKQKVENGGCKIYDVDLNYITTRGKWYFTSWKGSEEKSGGIVMNIGIHFFDMLIWVFGKVLENVVLFRSEDQAAGELLLERAQVKWFLNIRHNDSGVKAYRSITVDGQDLNFTDGFSDLHTKSYQEIFKGNGFGIDDVRPSIELANKINNY